MSDQDIIDEAVEAHQSGYPIESGQARVIAAAWHGGMRTALYAFASSGAIRDDLADEIRDEIAEDTPELEALLAWVEAEGTRGPVQRWVDTWG